MRRLLQPTGVLWLSSPVPELARVRSRLYGVESEFGIEAHRYLTVRNAVSLSSRTNSSTSAAALK